MSVAVIDLSGFLIPEVRVEVERYMNDDTRRDVLANIVHVVMDILSSDSRVLPEEIYSAGEYWEVLCDIGRIGLRPITSAWAIESFPGAKYELVITLIVDPDTIHVLLVYL